MFTITDRCNWFVNVARFIDEYNSNFMRDFIVLIVDLALLEFVALPELPLCATLVSHQVFEHIWELQSQGLPVIGILERSFELLNHSRVSTKFFIRVQIWAVISGCTAPTNY